NSVSKIFGFNVSDDNLANCSLIVDGIISSTNSSVNVSLGQSFSRVFTPGTYAWRINCSDFAGNVNGSSENSFVITAPAVAPSFSSSGGGGGGGSSVSASSGVYKVSVSEITVGYTKKLKKNDKVNFSIFDYKGGRHLLIVENVEIDYVDLVIESEPVKLRLGIGQSARLNLTSSYYYDLFVKLNSIVDGVAELTIQLINEPIEEKVVEVVREEVVETEVEVIIDYFWVVLVLVGVLVLVVLVVVRRRKGKKTKELKSGKGKKKDGKGKKIKT
ncbi:MAG: hypothetical protein KJ592_05280, partial [Nanoarchaeota archaeon]|nr:hypothetical protein [Nanoarchaeota archaeon]